MNFIIDKIILHREIKRGTNITTLQLIHEYLRFNDILYGELVW